MDIDSMHFRGTLFELPDGLSQLASGAGHVPALPMEQSDGGVDQRLVEGPEGAGFDRPPEILPYLMGLEVLAGIKKIYAGSEQLGGVGLT
jgi:hypothetical protein